MTEFYDKDFFMPLKFMALIMEIYLYYHTPSPWGRDRRGGG